VAWSGAGSDPSDNDPTFKIGEAEDEVALQIGVKSMKKRTVSVLVHPIASVVGSDINPPNLIPTKTQLEAELNKVFGWQINTYFNVTIAPTIRNVTFDELDVASFPNVTSYEPAIRKPIFGNGALDFASFSSKEIVTITNYRNADYDVNVFVVGGASPIRDYNIVNGGTKMLIPFEFAGITNPDGNYCVVDGDRSYPIYDDFTMHGLLNTIAHEVGHVMLGEGHPDDESQPGQAKLPGTDHTVRLMASGTKRAPDGNLMVRAEWEKAESWLKNRPNGDN